MITDMDLGFGNDNDPETELSFVNQWKLSNGEFFRSTIVNVSCWLVGMQIIFSGRLECPLLSIGGGLYANSRESIGRA